MTNKIRTNSAAPNEAEIRAFIEGFAKALRAKDAKAAAAHYADDVVSFDLAPPLEHRGAATLRKNLEDWFATWRSAIGYEFRDLDIAASGDLAVARSLNRISGKRTDGEDTDIWVRTTVCIRKIGGQWKVIHEHASVPFLMDGSFKAAVDLKP